MPLIKKVLPLFFVIVFSAFFCLSVVASLILLYGAHWDGPWSDMWEVMPFMQQGYSGVFQWSHLWEHYGNAHRFGLVKFLWLSDWWLSRGNNHFLILLSCFCQLIILCLFIKVADVKKWPVKWILLYISLLVFYLFNPSQLFNFFHTFDVQWFIVMASAVMVCFLIAVKRNDSVLPLLLIFLLGVIASLCNFSGMIILFAAVFLLWWWGVPRTHVLAFMLAVIGYYAVYAHGLNISSHNIFSVVVSLEDKTLAEKVVLAIGIPIVYPLIMLASPLSYVARPDGDWHIQYDFVVWMPYVVVVLLIGIVLFKLARQSDSSDIRIRFAANIFVYIMLTALAIAVGRGMFIETAFADRFQNIVLLFWMSIALMMLGWWGFKGLLLAAIFAVLSHGLTVIHQLDRSMVLVNRAALSHAALRIGVVDKLNALQGTVSKFQLIYSENYSLLKERQFLLEQGLGIFAEKSWEPPTRDEINGAKLCPEQYVVGEHYFTQLGMLSFVDMRITSSKKPAWFAYLNNDLVALLIPKRSDEFIGWITTPSKNIKYEGFMKDQFQPPLTLTLYAKEGNGWCKLNAVVE